MQYADDEVHFTQFANAAYWLGILDAIAGADILILDPKRLIENSALLDICVPEMKRLGLRASASHAEEFSKALYDTAIGKNPLSRGSIHDHITMLRTTLAAEMDATVFLHVGYSNAEFYRGPRNGWEEVIERFGDTVSDVDEASKCFALGRYAASVFHSTQVIEVGLIELGRFISIADPKSGFTAVCNGLKRVLDKKHNELTEFERTNRAFFEQVYGTAEALKNAWRNKISHAQGRLVLLSADFTPSIAEEIIYASRAFMRRLAEDMP